MRQRLRFVFLGLSLSSSWGNGHATTYRALLHALASRGHDILFLEREQPWYAEHRDMARPDFCELAFYREVAELDRWREAIATADAVVVGSYVPEGVAVAELVQQRAGGVVAFYDIDTPVTLAKLVAGDHEYLAPAAIPGFDLYLSFTGGPTLRRLERQFGARSAHALYCSVDPRLYTAVEAARRWDLGYLGTYSPDRQPVLDRLLLEPARRAPRRRFVVAGPLYPADIQWPENVERMEHLPPAEHATFYSSLGWTLNVTRADMVAAGHSPSVRLFEAASCGVPIISDPWDGLDTLFRLSREIVIAHTPEQVLSALALPEQRRKAIGLAGRKRVLAEHTAAHRARDLERLVLERAERRAVAVA
ncbi:MAG: glycosyltransferase [Alphaproteobacteria bacterium]|nr:glycosyltransferase [Alphaproteobacteria bacterium]